MEDLDFVFKFENAGIPVIFREFPPFRIDPAKERLLFMDVPKLDLNTQSIEEIIKLQQSKTGKLPKMITVVNKLTHNGAISRLFGSPY